jgi:hypothetical protein
MLIANFQLFFVWEFQITSAKKIILEEKKRKFWTVFIMRREFNKVYYQQKSTLKEV